MKFYKKITLTCFLLTIFVAPLAAQELNYVVPPENNYSYISSYSNGLAKVEIDYDSTGFLNSSGKLVVSVPYNYNYTGNFHNDRAFFETKVDGDYKKGFFNKKGKVVIPPIYDKVKNFSNNRAAVKKDDRWKIIDRQGKTVMTDSLLITTRTIISAYSHSSRQEDREPPSFNNGLIRVKRKGEYGYADTTGKIVIAFKYESAENFKDGMAVVSPADAESENYNWKLINTSGEVGYDFKDNQFPQFDTYFSSDGKIIFMEERRGKRMIHHKYGVVNSKGEDIVQPTYSRKPFPYSNGVAIFQVNGKQSDNKDGYMLVIDSTGTILSKIGFQTKYGTMYDSGHTFHDGLLAVKIQVNGEGTKWGYINKKGEFIIKPQFNTALNFQNDRAVVITKQENLAIIKNPLE